MSSVEYGAFINQIIAEDGHLDCVPNDCIMITFNNRLDYLIWIAPDYRRQIKT
jgi:hypothetical protein